MRPLGVAVVSGVPVESEGLQLAHHVRVHKNARTDLRVPQRPCEDVGVLHSPPDHHGEVASRQRRDLGKVDGDRIAVQPAPRRDRGTHGGGPANEIGGRGEAEVLRLSARDLLMHRESLLNGKTSDRPRRSPSR